MEIKICKWCKEDRLTENHSFLVVRGPLSWQTLEDQLGVGHL